MVEGALYISAFWYINCFVDGYMAIVCIDIFVIRRDKNKSSENVLSTFKPNTHFIQPVLYIIQYPAEN